MTKPLLQLALDCQEMNTAFTSIETIKDHIDIIIEVGTILAFAEGMSALKQLETEIPNHILVCDMRKQLMLDLLPEWHLKQERIGLLFQPLLILPPI